MKVLRPIMVSSQSQERCARLGAAPAELLAGAVFLLALLAAALIYGVGLNGPLLLDDVPKLSPLLDGRALQAGQWRAFVFGDTSVLGRPLSLASFVFNAVTVGNDVGEWKRLNLAIHLLNATLIFWLSAHLWCARKAVPDASGWLAGSVLGGVWLLHPLHVSTVLYTVQRMAELSALFVFAGLLSYVLARKRHLDGRPGYLHLGLCFLVFLPLAALSKENGLLLVPLAFLLEVFVFRFEGSMATRRALAALFTLFLAIPFLAGCALLIFRYGDILPHGYLARDFTWVERLLTQSRVLFLYLQQLLLPIQQTMGFLHDDFTVSRGLLTPPTTLLSMLGIALLAGGAWLVRTRIPLLSLGVLFFFVAHAMESTIFPLELVFEHRNYLPSYGVFLAVAAAAPRLLSTRRLRAGAAAVAVVALAGLTLLRVETWASEASLLNYAYRTHPNSDRVNAVLAQRLTQAGRYPAALAQLDGREGPGPALQKLYIRCLKDGALTDEDIDAVASSLPTFVDEYVASGLMNVGRLGVTGGCRFSHQRYSSLLARALTLVISHDRTRQGLGMYRAHYLKSVGSPAAAIAALREAHAVMPDNPVPLFLATEWLLEMECVERARAQFQKGLDVAEHSVFSTRDLVKRIERELERRTPAPAPGDTGIPPHQRSLEDDSPCSKMPESA